MVAQPHEPPLPDTAAMEKCRTLHEQVLEALLARAKEASTTTSALRVILILVLPRS